MPRSPDSRPDIDALIDKVMVPEGGFSDHPADRGGPTRWGVTEAVARAHGYSGDMRHFPREEAVAIFKRKFRFRPGFDQIAQYAPQTAGELFDTGINMGTGTAIGFLQRALNALNRNARDYDGISVDRGIGGETLAALVALLRKRGTSGEFVLLKTIKVLQGAQYRSSGNPSGERGFPLRLARQPDRLNSARNDFAYNIVKFVKNSGTLQTLYQLPSPHNIFLAPTLTNFEI